MFKRVSLKTKLVLLINSSLFILGLILVYSIFIYTKMDSFELVKEDLLHNTVDQAHLLKNTIHESIDLVKTIAQQESIINAIGGDINARNNLLSNLQEYNIANRYSAIYVFDINGVVIESTEPTFLGNNYGFREYFKKAMSGNLAVDVSIGVTSHELGYYFAYPILSKNKEILGVIVLKLKPDIIDRLISESGSVHFSDILLVDNYGIVLHSLKKDRIYTSIGVLKENERKEILETRRFNDIDFKSLAYDPALNLIREGGDLDVFQIFDALDNENEIIAVSKIDDLPFYVLIEQGLERAVVTPLMTALITSLFIVVFLLFSSIFTLLIIIVFLSPLSDFMNNIKKIDKGDLNVQFKVKNKDELGELGIALNKMIKELKDKRVELSKKIKQEKLAKNDAFRAKNRAEAIFMNINDGVFVIDRNSNIIACNNSATNMLSIDIKNIIGKKYDKIFKFISEDSNLKADFIEKSIKDGVVQKAKNHTLLLLNNEQKIPVLTSAAPIKNQKGEILSAVIIFKDIRKEYGVDKAKTEFLSLASHQLRTPLATTKWHIESLLTKKNSNKKIKEYLKQVNISNERMIDLVNALLNVSRIEMGSLNIKVKEVSLEKILKEVLDSLASLIKKKKIKIHKKYLLKKCLLQSDPKLLIIIFQNLLTNALKYTPKGGDIKLVLKVNKKNKLLVSISDNGYGIPKNQQSKIFTKLFRADNIIDKDTIGTGLGLFIVKACVNILKGKIWFESKENKGTTFFVELPLTGVKSKVGTRELI